MDVWAPFYTSIFNYYGIQSLFDSFQQRTLFPVSRLFCYPSSLVGLLTGEIEGRHKAKAGEKKRATVDPAIF